MPPGMCLRSGWRRRIPGVEIADDADALGIRRPDGEVHTFDAVDRARMGAELVVALPVLAFAEQVQIVIGQQRRESVGVVHCRLLAALVDDSEQVIRRIRCVGRRANGFVQTGRMNSPHRLRRRCGPDESPRPAANRAGTPARPRPGGRHRHLVRSQNFERVFVPTFDQGPNLIQLNTSSHCRVLQNCVHSPLILSQRVEFV